jgi:hypothetical protein
MNIDKDFTFQTIKLPDYEGEVRYVNFFKSQPRKSQERIIYMVIMTISHACSRKIQ